METTLTMIVGLFANTFGFLMWIGWHMFWFLVILLVLNTFGKWFFGLLGMTDEPDLDENISLNRK